MYNMDEPGFKLTYISGNQKLLAVKFSKRFTVIFGKKGRNRDNSGLHEYKWKKLDFPNGSV
jgi:hypothetical protein